MTRKDYETIAAAVHSAKSTMGVRYMLTKDKGQAASETTARIASELADALAKGNPRFDRDKFINACFGY